MINVYDLYQGFYGAYFMPLYTLAGNTIHLHQKSKK